MTDNEVDYILEHHGVKGMKWGRRKQKELDSYNRVLEGKAKALERLHVYANVSMVEIAAAGSARNVIEIRAKGLEEQKQRIESGKATVADKLDRALNTSMIDLLKNK